jgi:endonuclease YncB( thermonuclease family)
VSVSNIIHHLSEKGYINFLPIIAIVGLTWYGLQPKTSRETLSIPQSQSATIQIPNGEPDPDAAASLPEYEVVANSVHDGDTLRVRSSKGEILKVRFACVDAPELKQPLGEESRNHLRSIINRGNNKVRVQPITTDRYGRTVAQLWNGNGLI